MEPWIRKRERLVVVAALTCILLPLAIWSAIDDGGLREWGVVAWGVGMIVLLMRPAKQLPA